MPNIAPDVGRDGSSMSRLNRGFTMSRKDYVLLANAIATVKQRLNAQGANDMAVDAVDVVRDSVADALASDNYRFDRSRFVDACNAE